MKRIKYFFIFPCLIIGSIISCTPDYVTNATTESQNPSHPSEQSIILNYTSGEFVGILTKENFTNGIGVAFKQSIEQDIVYNLLYNSNANLQFNAILFNKTLGEITTQSDAKIIISRDNKNYICTSGEYEISQIKTVASQMGTDIIQCKFVFDGIFKVTPKGSSEIIENGVKINGTVVF